ncbi:MAG: UDP-3-O-acyl-N-acetylglucosamine deacetylase, partial [Methylobacterium radiotolerans]
MHQDVPFPRSTSSTGPRQQATLARPFERSGRSLHSGRHATVRVSPAPAGHGIVFRRHLKDGRAVDVPAHWHYRESQPLSSALRRDGVLVRTIEHLMASLSALRIDNVLAEIDADELPIFDGSATPWCEAIRIAGRREQSLPCRVIRLLRTVAVENGRRRLEIEPGPGLHITGHVALAHFGSIDWSGAITPESFERGDRAGAQLRALRAGHGGPRLRLPDAERLPAGRLAPARQRCWCAGTSWAGCASPAS